MPTKSMMVMLNPPKPASLGDNVSIPPLASCSPLSGWSSSNTNTETWDGGWFSGSTRTVTSAKVPVHVVAGGTGVQAAQSERRPWHVPDPSHHPAGPRCSNAWSDPERPGWDPAASLWRQACKRHYQYRTLRTRRERTGHFRRMSSPRSPAPRLACSWHGSSSKDGRGPLGVARGQVAGRGLVWPIGVDKESAVLPQ